MITGQPDEQCGGQHPDGRSPTILQAWQSLLCQVLFFIFTFFAAKLPFKFLSSYLLRTLLEFIVALLLSGWLAVYGFIIEVLPLLLDQTSLPPKIWDLEDKNLRLFNKIFVTTGRPSDLLQRPCGYVRVLRGSHTILSVSGFDLDWLC